MIKHLKKKNIILSILPMVILASLLLIGIDLNSKGSKIKKISQIITNKTQILANDIPTHFFTPRYPKRLMALAAEMRAASRELVYLNEELKNFTLNCDCQYAQSQCRQEKLPGIPLAVCKTGPTKTFGEPCPQKEKINEKQSEIKNKLAQLSYLQKLLEEEMASGLAEELETLDPETAEELEASLEELLQFNQDIVEPAENNRNLPFECLAEKCSPVCHQELSFTLKACLLSETGQQDPMEAVFEGGVSLQDLDLGKVGIKNINLGLPEKINLSNLLELSSFSIHLPEVTITFPEVPVSDLKKTGSFDLSHAPIIFHPPSPKLPSEPTLIELSCPELPDYQPYQCSITQSTDPESYIEAEWYFQTFSFLSEKCQELPDMTGFRGLPTDEIYKCFDPANVHLTIIEKCDAFWASYDPENPPAEIPPICQSLGSYCLGKQTAKERECKNLFNQENKPIPQGCYLNVLCQTYKPVYCEVPAYCGSNGTDIPGYITKENVEMIITTLKNKCEQLKTEKRKVAPELCKFLPLFTREFPTPEPFEYSQIANNCSAQSIGDFPASMLGCPFSPPTIPKITLPKIIIPDIHLPHIKFLPFFEIKLPNIIFEDLSLPDLLLCNLDACSNLFPFLKFRLPSLNIPQVTTSPFQLPDLEVFIEGIGLVKIPLPEVEIGRLQYPPIALNFLQAFNLGKLITPELALPQISLPQPQIYFAFKAFNINPLNILWGLLKQAFNLPSGCIGIDFRFIPLRIIFPDFIFAWPAFPEIPDFCKDIRDFCQEIKKNLKEVTDKISQIEEVVNEVFQEEIQEKLNQAAQKINQIISNTLQRELAKRAQKIKEEIEKHIQQRARIEAGSLKIPPLTIPLGPIEIPGLSLTDLVTLPTEISIPWPAELKKITLAKDIGYQLPTIPLSKISYRKEIRIKIPGFQLPSARITLSLLENFPACLSKEPSGGNPCPTGQIQANLQEIKQIKGKIEQTSQKIIDILE